jgi:tetratricopeptide (TPR) repeat protein
MLTLGRESGDQVAVAYALAQLGYVAHAVGDFARAEALSEESVELSRQVGDDACLANALFVQSVMLQGQAQYERAREVIEEGLMVARRCGAAVIMAAVLSQLARCVIGLGDLDRAVALCEALATIRREFGDRYGLEHCNRILTRIAQLKGDATWGETLARDNLVYYRDIGAEGHLATVLDSLAWVARTHGDPRRAIRLFAAAEARRDALGKWLQAEVRGERDAELALARTSLGEDAFAAAWAEGRAMTLEQAVAYALDEAAERS